MAFNFRNKRSVAIATMTAFTLGLAACAPSTTDTSSGGTETETAAAGSDVSGTILIDGSSTVYPVSEAMAEEFMAANSGVQVTVGTSGTGGGFEKFCSGETDISNASRPIDEEEIASCEAAGIEYVELPVATDALTVVVNPENDWAECLTIEQLETIWRPESQGTISNWNQVDPSFPDAPLALYGPGTDSGTFDYFTEVIGGESGASRGDYTASEDDNVLVQGVTGDTNAIAYFGYAYYVENTDSLKAVSIDDGNGCVEPTQENVLSGNYTPLARPLFIYVSRASLEEKPQVQAFIDFYLDPANKEFVGETGYVTLTDAQYTEAKGLLDK
ncbi:PstS family phosphate ABC transporter substrate-binding protein [Leptolyngbya sp. AN02str]|uniref:PstS family phosphate ABC transporter substrate-binding protein n=1 Tax=Leptolyngbya sp. AN02str TaxID=3423363 RepID=UPI003D3202D4